MLISLYKWITM